MLEVVYYVAASLDGYIATSEGGIEWLPPIEKNGEDYGYAEFYNSIEVVLIGRRTYEQSLTFGDWPYPDKPCWVFSRSLNALSPPEARLTTQSPAQVVAEIAAEGFRRAWLLGGGELAASFRAQGLITEYIVSVIPVILGAGVPLFAADGPMESLELVETRAYPNGIVQLRYLSGKGA